MQSPDPGRARSLLARLADFLAARDAEPGRTGGVADPAEIWGRRVGRSLGVLAFLGLLFWLACQIVAR